ncbi:MAG TPA: PSD1 and planctomycete cytochrome C domain-containing protein [Gemmataceae bacterium]
MSSVAHLIPENVLRFLLAGLLAALFASAGRAGNVVDFNRDIRPILSDKCFFCHGPDKKQRKAGLRLDDRDVAVKKKAIVPGKPDESELIDRINATDDAKMPPEETHKTLTAAQKDVLKRWIAAGASYEPHWAYAPITRPSVPEIANAKSQISNAIDAFVLAKLQEKNIAPSSEADKARLLRRLSLDLIGLPPTPEELRAFLADPDPRAYEKQVDRLLASPRYGERMAAGWLDLARYADSVGFHGDQPQNVFPYRDYVIDSFNKNKPFDRFTIEQLAGDLLPNATTEQKIASGFNRLNMMTREGGAQPKEYLAKYAADRVRTVSTTFLGSTMGCCECHDHKYDPFLTKDFYSMEAFFADVKQWGVYADYSYTRNLDLLGFNNDYPFPPEIEVTSPYLVRRAEKLRKQIGELATAAFAKETSAGFAAWSEVVAMTFAVAPDGWRAAKVIRAPDGDKVLDDGSVLIGGPTKTPAGKKAKSPQESLEVTLKPGAGWLAAVRLELLPDPAHDGSCFRGGRDGSTVKLTASVKKAGGKAVPVTFHRADAEHESPRYQLGQPVIGILGGWKTDPKHAKERQQAVWLLDPVQLADGDELVVKLSADGLGRVRLATSPVATLDPFRSASAVDLSGTGNCAAATAYLLSTAFDKDAYAKAKALERDFLECRNGKTWSLVTEAWKPAVTRVLPRGNWQDESGAVVEPAVPGFLPPVAHASGSRLTRLDLAKWIVSKDNPLTARAFVNRLWKQFFGNGLSAVVDDLGAQGEPPSHPELLDWLASEFRDSGWDVKHVVKLIVMSRTYRQDSRVRPELKDVDPQNRLLAYQNPRRLDAEFVHDNALFVAGLLDGEIGGPSAHPYQPAGYYAAIQFPDRDYYPEKDERQYRRGVYTWWQRTFLHPYLANFDAPSREDCTANRVVSNTPQQALTLLNSPIFIEAARVFAARLLSGDAKTDEARLDAAFERALARKPKAEEKAALLKYLTEQTAYFRGHPEAATKILTIGQAPPPAGDAATAAGWTAVCRVLLNLHETITRY